jgi:hypothetical protein
MSANRIVPNRSRAQAFGPSGIYGGISSLGLALLCACSGAIEETDVDERRVDFIEARGPATASPTGSTPAPTTPAARAPATTPPATTPVATPPATTPVATPPAATPPAATPPAASAATVSFETDIWPIFNAQCAPCHTVANIVQNIGADDKDAAFDDAVSFKDAIVSTIERGTMPQGTCSGAPGTSGCVSVADLDLIKAWVEDGTPP